MKQKSLGILLASVSALMLAAPMARAEINFEKPGQAVPATTASVAPAKAEKPVKAVAKAQRKRVAKAKRKIAPAPVPVEASTARMPKTFTERWRAFIEEQQAKTEASRQAREAAKAQSREAARAKAARPRVVVERVGGKPLPPAQPEASATLVSTSKPAAQGFGLSRRPKAPDLSQAAEIPVDLQEISTTLPPARRPAAAPLFGLFASRQTSEPVDATVLSDEQLGYDEAIASVPERKKFKVDDKFKPTVVAFGGYKPGTVVIDTKSRYLYYVDTAGTAIRYGVAVGKEGLLYTGRVKVGDKQPWPRWIPTKDMIEREPKKYKQYEEGMDGGTENPLGARAIYLHLDGQDTHLRIHGTTQPGSIGTASSNGCFRMINEHVIDLYERVKLGADVVVL